MILVYLFLLLKDNPGTKESYARTGIVYIVNKAAVSLM